MMRLMMLACTVVGMHSDTDSPRSDSGRRPLQANCAYLLSDYKGKEGGAIAFVPGSHKLPSGPWLPDQMVPDKIGAVPVVAPFGSLVVWNGATWHGSYAKKTPGIRVNLTLYHCAANAMTQERYRETVTDELLDKYGEEFAVLMGQATHNGWQAEGPTCE